MARDELLDINQKLDRLLALQLSGSLSQSEYIAKKETLILKKKDLEGKLSSLERKSDGWFEPATSFIKSLDIKEISAALENQEQILDFLKNSCSNPSLTDCSLNLQLKAPWIFADELNKNLPSGLKFGTRKNPRRGRFRFLSQHSALLEQWSNFFKENPDFEF